MVLKPKSVYRKIYKHQNNKCFYCKTEVELSIMEREHVFPRSKGGRGIANMVLSCPFCNSIKKDLTIEEFNENVKELIHTTDDVVTIHRYIEIILTLTELLNGQLIRNGWHKKSTYKSTDINNPPIKV